MVRAARAARVVSRAHRGAVEEPGRGAARGRGTRSRRPSGPRRGRAPGRSSPTPRASDSDGSPVGSGSPSTRISPSVGATTPETHLISVDLPAPFGPSRQCTSPGVDVEVDPVERAHARVLLGDAADLEQRRRSSLIAHRQRLWTGDVDPAVLARGGEHGLGDHRGAQAVGEDRQPVGAARAVGSRRRRPRRTRRSSRRSPADDRPAAWPGARPAGDRYAGSRLTSVARLAAADTTATPAAPGRTRATPPRRRARATAGSCVRRRSG